MAIHVSAADAPEDLWRCHECGWTYPNHHPSAKHRRNHKKQCGKLPGFSRTKDLTSYPQVVNGSSDDGSSEEEHYRSSAQVAYEKNGYHQEHLQPPIQAGASDVEQICDKGSTLLSSNDGEPLTTPHLHEESAVSTRNLDLSDPKDFGEKRNGDDQDSSTLSTGRGNFRSAHAYKGQWTCRHCGWAYPNAHPSAKNRRKHKKTCGMGAQHVGAGGSSDETSSDDGNGTAELLKGDSSAFRGSPGSETIKQVNAKDTDLFKVVGGAAVDPAQVSTVSDSSNSLALRSMTLLDGVLGGKEERKLESGDSRVAMADEGNIQPADEQASGDAKEISVPRTESNGVEASDLDGPVIHQLPRNSASEHVYSKKANLPDPSLRISAQEHVDQSINGLEREISETDQSLSPVVVGSPEPDTKIPQPVSALRAGIPGESLTVEKLRSPTSPEGLVRSRIQIFEKLAGTSPQYLVKSVSPKTNPGSSHVQENITGYLCETPEALRETVSGLRHRQFSERMAQSAAKHDAPSELQEAMSHLLHRNALV